MTVVAVWTAAMAIPAKPGLQKTVTQSDGTTIALRMVGDEWHHSWVTDDGLPTVEAPNGDMVYRTADGASAMIAHEKAHRSAAEETFIALNANKMTAEAIIAATPRAQAAKNMRKAGPRKAAGNAEVPQIGAPKIPIILVQYSDVSFKNSKETFVKQYTSTTDLSAYKYFYDQSDGQYRPQYDVYGPYTLSGTRATYGGNDSSGNDKGVATMVGEAIDKAGDDINWADYDNDNDGEADVCIVVYAGGGEAQTSVAEQIWPCQWNLSSGAYYGDGSGARTRNGKTIDKFAVFNELNGKSTSKIDGVGTFCHEFGHCMGLPDFYETTYSNGYYGMGYWDIMCAGSYNNDGYCPIGYNAYEKEFMGWYTPVTPTENTQYTLPKWNTGNDIAIKVTSPLNKNECYYLENRAKQGWDAYIADEGVLVTHLTYVASRWTDNTPNNKAVQLFTVIPADNKLSTNNESADCYGESNHELTDSSTPAASLNMTASGSLASSTGGAGKMGQPITEINLNSNGSATLWYMKGSEPSLPQLVAPTLAEADHIKATSFRASWTDNTNTDNTYTLVVEKPGAYSQLLSESMESLTSGSTNIANSLDNYLTNKGWTGSYLMAGNQYLIINYRRSNYSSSYSKGTLVTPELDLSNSGGKVTVKFQAAATSSTPLVVSCGNSSETISDLTTSFAEKTVVLDCTAAAGQKITFAGNGTSGFIGIAEIEIYSGTEDSNAGEVYTFPGITEKNYTVQDLTEGETYSFKVKAVPIDETVAQESEWSNVRKVTLAATPPTLTVSATEVALGNVEVGATGSASFKVTGSDLDDVVTLTLNDENNVFSLDKQSLTISEAEAGATINATFAPTRSGSFTATVQVATTGTEPATVTLTATAPLEKSVPVMLAADEAEVEATAFTARWSDDTPAENVASYTLTVSGGQAEQVYLLNEEDFSNVTWTKSGTTSTGSGYLRLGNTRSSKGRATSPKLTPTSNVVTVEVAALGYNANSQMKVSVLDASNTSNEIASETFTLTTAQTTYTALLNVTANAEVNVRVENMVGYAQVYNAKVYNGDATEGATAPAHVSESGDENTRTITGITDKSYRVENLVAGATYSYKVKAVYVDDTESRWSNVENVTLSEKVLPVTLEAQPEQLNFELVEGETDAQSITVTTANLRGAVTLALNDDNNVFSLDKNEVSDEQETVTVTFAPETAGEFDATVTLSTEGADDVVVNLHGTAAMLKEVPELEPADMNAVTDRTFMASWTAVPHARSYTLQVNKVGAAGAAARAQETGNATSRTITGITETNYLVANLDRTTTYRYRVQAIYEDGSEGEWSNTETVTTKVKTGIDAIAATGRVSLDGNTLTGDEFTRVYTAAGVELPAVNGRWTLHTGVYLIATPEAVAKVIIK